jgi:hypothetical protein
VGVGAATDGEENAAASERGTAGTGVMLRTGVEMGVMIGVPPRLAIGVVAPGVGGATGVDGDGVAAAGVVAVGVVAVGVVAVGVAAVGVAAVGVAAVGIAFGDVEPSFPILTLLSAVTECGHGRMARGGHGHPKVSLGPAMTDPSTPCGQATS